MKRQQQQLQQQSPQLTLGLLTPSCSPDEWELDANDVTLGVELGQGAFGLVMTGFYHNTQVAIKVIQGK